MPFESLFALSAIDGRYQEQLQELSHYVSEGALSRYRVMTEAHWLLHLSEITPPLLTLSGKSKSLLVDLSQGKIALDDLKEIKETERQTNHDVKAVEYWIQQKLRQLGAPQETLSHVHFACTSEDINNVSYAWMLHDLREQIILPKMDEIISHLKFIATTHKKLPLLSRTHGQTATPTTLGKEFAVFSYRLSRQRQRLSQQEILAKFNGAVGNYNAHVAAHPKMDWLEISRSFIQNRLKFTWNPLTTQIENHDSFVEFWQHVRHFNTILLDFSRDMWSYISLGYFAQKTVGHEVGSSTMPHKVNPIFFENAEGNFGISSSLIQHFSEKLPVSRWQRDLSDSTVLRVTGTVAGHSLLGWKNILRGLGRVQVNPRRIEEDLKDAWELLAEPVQTVMRRFGVVDAYDRLKTATRGEATVTQQMIWQAIDQCQEIPEDVRVQMKAWTPNTYLGLSTKLVEKFIETSI